MVHSCTQKLCTGYVTISLFLAGYWLSWAMYMSGQS